MSQHIPSRFCPDPQSGAAKETWSVPQIYEVARTLERARKLIAKAKEVRVAVRATGQCELVGKWFEISKVDALIGVTEMFLDNERHPTLYPIPVVQLEDSGWCWIGG